MHFIDVGFKSSCSSSTDYYYSKIDLYGLTENDEEINIISWIDINENSLEVHNNNINSSQLSEIRELLAKKHQKGYSILDFSYVNEEKTKRKGFYVKN